VRDQIVEANETNPENIVPRKLESIYDVSKSTNVYIGRFLYVMNGASDLNEIRKGLLRLEITYGGDDEAWHRKPYTEALTGANTKIGKICVLRKFVNECFEMFGIRDTERNV